MVHKLRCQATEKRLDGRRVAGNIATVVFILLGMAATLSAQQREVHYLHQGAMPPGAIGSRQLQRGGPLVGFFQPVEIKAPPGALVSLAVAGNFEPPRKAPIRAGLLIGQVYRLRVMDIPLRAGLEVFPTVEIIDRLYTPRDQQRRFAIPIELTEEDLKLAMDGKFVTRVIYLEDVDAALPVAQKPGSMDWFEAGVGQDPLAVADAMGRPVAILRLGARLPDDAENPGQAFLYNSPPFVKYASRPVAAGPKEMPPEEPQP